MKESHTITSKAQAPNSTYHTVVVEMAARQVGDKAGGALLNPRFMARQQLEGPQEPYSPLHTHSEAPIAAGALSFPPAIGPAWVMWLMSFLL